MYVLELCMYYATNISHLWTLTGSQKHSSGGKTNRNRTNAFLKYWSSESKSCFENKGFAAAIYHLNITIHYNQSSVVKDPWSLRKNMTIVCANKTFLKLAPPNQNISDLLHFLIRRYVAGFKWTWILDSYHLSLVYRIHDHNLHLCVKDQSSTWSSSHCIVSNGRAWSTPPRVLRLQL